MLAAVLPANTGLFRETNSALDSATESRKNHWAITTQYRIHVPDCTVMFLLAICNINTRFKLPVLEHHIFSYLHVSSLVASRLVCPMEKIISSPRRQFPHLKFLKQKILIYSEGIWSFERYLRFPAASSTFVTDRGPLSEAAASKKLIKKWKIELKINEIFLLGARRSNLFDFKWFLLTRSLSLVSSSKFLSGHLPLLERALSLGYPWSPQHPKMSKKEQACMRKEDQAMPCWLKTEQNFPILKSTSCSSRWSS